MTINMYKLRQEKRLKIYPDASIHKGSLRGHYFQVHWPKKSVTWAVCRTAIIVDFEQLLVFQHLGCDLFHYAP